MKYYRTFFFLVFGLVAYLAFKVVSPLLESMIMGAVMAYVFYPIYTWLNERVKRPMISAGLVCILIVLLTSLPLFILGRALLEEAKTVYVTARQTLLEKSFLTPCEDRTGLLCPFQDLLAQGLSDPGVKAVIEETARTVGHTLTGRISAVITGVPYFLIFLFVSFFISFYLFIDGPRLLARIRSDLPIKTSCLDLIQSRISALVRAAVFGSVLVAFIQGVLGAIGFLVLGVPQPLLWGLVMAIAALIPFIGTAVVWGPAALLLVAVGSPLKGLLLAVYGALVISTIDNLLKPLIIGTSARIHPLLVLLGVFGGIGFFGPLGFVIGPVILATFEALLEAYELEKGELV